MKVLMILIDGMRPDMIGDIPEAQRLMSESTYTLEAKTVFPSVTLPCHMSLFHSVDPDRHGTATNTYAPQVRPIEGLCEVLKRAKKSCAFYYNWEQLRDLARPGSLNYAYFAKGAKYGWEEANRRVASEAEKNLAKDGHDFAFLYLGWVDEAGHASGWGSGEYMRALRASFADIERIRKKLPEDYTVIVLADHGGHDRTHGTTMSEDMTIPVMLCGKPFEKNRVIDSVSIKDIAPTIADLLGVEADEDWEGKSLAEI